MKAKLLMLSLLSKLLMEEVKTLVEETMRKKLKWEKEKQELQSSTKKTSLLEETLSQTCLLD